MTEYLTIYKQGSLFLVVIANDPTAPRGIGNSVMDALQDLFSKLLASRATILEELDAC